MSSTIEVAVSIHAVSPVSIRQGIMAPSPSLSYQHSLGFPVYIPLVPATYPSIPSSTLCANACDIAPVAVIDTAATSNRAYL